MHIVFLKTIHYPIPILSFDRKMGQTGDTLSVLNDRSMATNEYNKQLRERLLEELGSACVRCGFDDPRALQIDHVYGGGIDDKGRGPSRYLRMLREQRDSPPGSRPYQLLCANCNWIKKHDNNENPRQPGELR